MEVLPILPQKHQDKQEYEDSQGPQTWKATDAPDKQSYKSSSNQGKDKSQKAAIIQEHSTIG